MRHLTLPAALTAACLTAGAAWAQSSGGGSGSSGGGAGGTSSSTAAPATGSATSPDGTNRSMRPPVQASPGTTGTLENRTGPNDGVTGDAATGGSTAPRGSQGSTGAATTNANRSSGDPETTGGVSGTSRLQPGERSAVSPSAREEELFREGEQLEQRARQGICSECGAQP
ncbi:hypothetical protein [Microvirga arsenatis]|uniref:Uncharacterized protein n=1 Tax=Microvirga arsenatis TaxID=2692265 RepID=A0ABW9Z0K3_9HYPH|nr:hypothetical protein [Microvirga arsenatis]NBJ12385.1 hypothetical protein [Microvirga arsenatis]NBJ26176.1 hypothetical protein [Microvirga arsenatis]